MKFLALDTTKSISNIIVFDNKKIDISSLSKTRKISEMLLSSIDTLLENNNIKLNAFDYFACVTGPGSFTGLRIGISTIKAFNAVLNKKLITLNSFEVLIDEVKNGCIILVCTKHSFYYAIIKNSQIIETGVDELSNIQNEKYSQRFACEEELKKYANYFIDNYANILIKAILKKIKNNQTTSANEFKPIYIQKSQAERNLKNNK